MDEMTAIKILDEIKYQFETSLAEAQLDEEFALEAQEDNKGAVKAIDIAIEASRKQIAIKIKWDDCRCPICREKLQGYEKYCWECGKRLDWH